MAKTRTQLLILLERALRELRDQEPFESEEKWNIRLELCAEIEGALFSASTPHIPRVDRSLK